MKSRLLIFLAIGTVLGLCAGVAATAIGLHNLSGDASLQHPAFVNAVAKGAVVWALFGLVSAGLQFAFTIGSSPTILDIRTGFPLQDPALEAFDTRHVGSKMIYIIFLWSLIAATLVIPWLSVPDVVSTRSVLARVLVCFVASAFCVVPVQLVFHRIIIKRARRRAMSDRFVVVKSTARQSSPETNPAGENAFMSADKCFKRGAFRKALTYIEEALEANPKDLRALNKKGGILTGMNRYDEAIACFDRILETDPAYCDAILSKGPLLTVLGKHEEAASHYQSALQHRPKDHRILVNLANACIRLGRKREALKYFEEAFEISHDTKLLSSIQFLKAELRDQGQEMDA